MCAHCLRVPTEQEVIGPPVAAPRLNPGAMLRLDYASGEWHTRQPPRPVLCDHEEKPPGSVLCGACEADLFRALADVPRLVADLELHLTKQNVFLERGLDPEDEVIEESPLPYAEAASSALDKLTRVLGTPPAAAAVRHLQRWRETVRMPHLVEFASRVTRAVAKAFSVIDTVPYLTHYGRCPVCKRDIRQERVPEGAEVKCQCGYAAEVGEHRIAQLDLAADIQMPLTRIVSVLNDAGERTSRQEIENMIYRDGLPREQQPVWQDGRIEKVWHYRLGDVREWRARKRRKRLDTG